MCFKKDIWGLVVTRHTCIQNSNQYSVRPLRLFKCIDALTGSKKIFGLVVARHTSMFM